MLLFKAGALFFEALLFGLTLGFCESDALLLSPLMGLELLAAEAFFFEMLFFLQALGFASSPFGFLLEWRRAGTKLRRRCWWRGRRRRLYGWGWLRLLRDDGLRLGFRLRNWLGFDGRFGAALDFEEDAAGGAHIEDWGGPLLTEASTEEGFARFGDGGVYREAIGYGAVELFGEGFGCVVADLELHGDDSGEALLTEALRYSGEGILAGLTRSFAGVENSEAEAVVVAKDVAE